MGECSEDLRSQLLLQHCPVLLEVFPLTLDTSGLLLHNGRYYVIAIKILQGDCLL